MRKVWLKKCTSPLLFIYPCVGRAPRMLENERMGVVVVGECQKVVSLIFFFLLFEEGFFQENVKRVKKGG